MMIDCKGCGRAVSTQQNACAVCGRSTARFALTQDVFRHEWQIRFAKGCRPNWPNFAFNPKDPDLVCVVPSGTLGEKIVERLNAHPFGD